MDNQHRKITGYRELSQADIDLMNRVKSLGPLAEEILAEVAFHVAAQRANLPPAGSAERSVECARLDRSQPERWMAVARTHFQEGLMALTRAVAQPTFF